MLLRQLVVLYLYISYSRHNYINVNSVKMNRFMLVFVIFLTSDVFAKAQIPLSARSIKVIRRVNPIVKNKIKEKELTIGNAIFIRIFKEENELELWIKNGNQFQLFHVYPICYYSGVLGPKIKEGDSQSPEGFYFVKPQNMNPWSSFHLSMNIRYPNKYDRVHGYTGDYLMIHGACASIGCYAMTNEGIEEIYTIATAALDNRQNFIRVHVFPFRMTDENMERYRGNIWFDFWKNLQEGYAWFEKYKIPPNVEAKMGRYVFN